MTDTALLRKQLVDHLVSRGVLRSSQWRTVFETVPRDVFLPRFFTRTDDGLRYAAVDFRDSRWLDLVYRDQAWTTQLDGDDHIWQTAYSQGPVAGTPTSSSSQPSLMAAMLESLDVQDGSRVLEIGTGTGYNAALLSQRLGDSHVVSIDIDPTLAKSASDCLARAGYHPTIVIGDGINAHIPGSPFDRLIATVAVSAIPATWLSQIQSGGRILANLDSELGGGALISLTVNNDGSASGNFDATTAFFMPTRSRSQTSSSAVLLKAALRDTRTTKAGQSRCDPGILDNQEFLFFASLLLPDVSRMGFTPIDNEPQEWLLACDGSWAYCTPSGLTSQVGNRALWDELDAAVDQWHQLDQPARQRFGLTITTKTGHQLWLDKPEAVLHCKLGAQLAS